MAAALELRDLHAAYGRIEVLHGVDLVVPEASVFALLGPNGAGKTTSLKTIDGRLRPTRGCVHVADTHVNGASSDGLARAGLVSIPEGRGVFPNLTVGENLRMMTYAGNYEDEVEEIAYGRFPILGERRKQLAGTLSGGQQQMLAMARALSSNPSLLLVDELSMGLAPLIVAELYEVLSQLAAEGVAILLVEQFARTALAIADYAAIMVQGRVQHVGQPADLADVVSEAYLGGAA
ncbi:MAG: ABC transporter ATP-binding protein [Acidimicrobiia bacterium]|nr:ABC transporter ATP-binding protein [Acidimicrobiia bacterium]